MRHWAPVSALSAELVRFDTQALQTPDISGIEYCHGTLLGYEVREYLLEKWGRRCAYCDAEGVPLQIEHIRSKARGGSDRISNWTLACQCCNQDKAARSIEEFLAKDPVRPARLKSTAQRPLRDAAAVNSTRWALVEALRALGLPVETSSGGRTWPHLQHTGRYASAALPPRPEDRGFSRGILMKRMTLALILFAASAIAHDRDAPINTASELRDWCKDESEAALIAKGNSPFNWTARYWDQGNTLMVKGQWRISGSNVAVECSVARGAQARFATMSAQESTQESPE